MFRSRPRGQRLGPLQYIALSGILSSFTRSHSGRQLVYKRVVMTHFHSSVLYPRTFLNRAVHFLFLLADNRKCAKPQVLLLMSSKRAASFNLQSSCQVGAHQDPRLINHRTLSESLTWSLRWTYELIIRLMLSGISHGNTKLGLREFWNLIDQVNRGGFERGEEQEESQSVS